MSSELDRATIVLATKSVSETFTEMVEDLAKIEPVEILPLVDQMKITFGPNIADIFSKEMTTAIDSALSALKSSKNRVSSVVARLEGVLQGEDFNSELQTDLDNTINQSTPVIPDNIPNSEPVPTNDIVSPDNIKTDDVNNAEEQPVMPEPPQAGVPMGRTQKVTENIVNTLTDNLVNRLFGKMLENTTYIAKTEAKKTIPTANTGDEVIVNDPSDSSKMKVAKVSENNNSTEIPSKIFINKETFDDLIDHLKEHNLDNDIELSVDEKGNNTIFFKSSEAKKLTEKYLNITYDNDNINTSLYAITLENPLKTDVMEFINTQTKLVFLNEAKTNIAATTKIISMLESLAIPYKQPSRISIKEIAPPRTLKPYTAMTLVRSPSNDRKIVMKKIGAGNINEAIEFGKGKKTAVIRIDKKSSNDADVISETVLAIYDHNGKALVKLSENVKSLYPSAAWSHSEILKLAEQVKNK